MKYKILKQFNPTQDILSETQIREIQYDVGELEKVIKNHNKTKSLHYRFHINESKKNTTHTLIFLPNFSAETLAQLGKVKISKKNYYYFIDKHDGDCKEMINTFLNKKSIEPLNFINYFRKSNFNNWKIVILNAEEINIKSIVINTFLALGAHLDNPQADNKLVFLKNVPLSFQHSIDVYKIK